jgi:hypothetical protein
MTKVFALLLLALAGIALAMKTQEPEIRRYLKIESM